MPFLGVYYDIILIDYKNIIRGLYMKKRTVLLKDFLLSDRVLYFFLLIYFIYVTAIETSSLVLSIKSYHLNLQLDRLELDRLTLFAMYGHPIRVWFENVAIILILLLFIELRKKTKISK